MFPLWQWYWLACVIGSLLVVVPAQAQPEADNLLDPLIPSEQEEVQNVNPPAEEDKDKSETSSYLEGFGVFPVGLNIDERNVNPGVLVRGKEDGMQAIDFSNWLVPYEAVIQVLKLDVTPLQDGQIEVRSPGLVTRIDPSQLGNDPELGLVLTIKEVRTLLGVPVEFDINEYAIIFNPPWLGLEANRSEAGEVPIQLDGLPELKPKQLTLTALEQRVNGVSSDSSLNYRGELTAIGTLLSGSWYLSANQTDFLDSRTWYLNQAQYLRQTDSADYVVGSQPTFWRSRSGGEYWGFTTIQRRGFTPPISFGGGGFSPDPRLQASQVGRTIIGEAEPGTLVRLSQGFNEQILAEVLVDSSGIYRFEDVIVGGRSFAGSYRLLLYPQGRLTAQPEIREATFSTVRGQIPAGTSATIISGGFGRQATGQPEQNFLGELKDFRGGIAQRWGVSESLTLGIGGVYDQKLRGLGELFFRPSDIPIEMAVSLFTADAEGSWDVDANFLYRPSSSFSAQFSSDRLSQRLNLNWQVFPRITLLGTYNSRDGVAVGLQTSLSGRGFFSFGRVTLDEQNRFRWNAIQRLGRWEFNQQGSEIGISSELTYNLFGRSSASAGHSLLLSHETRSLNQSNHLLSLGWRYRSQTRSADGSYLWETQLGYSQGSQGSGFFGTLQTSLVPGLLLRGRYETVSLTSAEADYSLELVSSFNLQRGISAGDRLSDRFRTQGGLLIQPFFDQNSNGQLDGSEEVYTENPELLLIVNNKPIESFRPVVQANRILVRLTPGIYRLELDPSGFPLDWQAPVDAYAVEVVAGSYTPVLVPLTLSYSLSGVVTNVEGKAVAGTRVEAIESESGKRRISVTNGAGVYYLERLQQGTYKLEINGQSAQPNTIRINNSSEPFQEVNLQQP
ncbi:MAG: carboxypeptidase-like regulatory domain-containing protein [Coleofasciculaceae cyanobacterium]